MPKTYEFYASPLWQAQAPILAIWGRVEKIKPGALTSIWFNISMGHAIAMKEAYSRQQLMKSRCNLPSAGRTVNTEPIAFGDFGFHVPEAGS